MMSRQRKSATTWPLRWAARTKTVSDGQIRHQLGREYRQGVALRKHDRRILSSSDRTHSIDAANGGRGAATRFGGSPRCVARSETDLRASTIGDRCGRRGHRGHLAASCRSRRARGAPARRPREPARRRVRYTLSGPAEPLGAASRDRARDLGNPAQDRADRSHRRHAGRRRQGPASTGWTLAGRRTQAPRPRRPGPGLRSRSARCRRGGRRVPGAAPDRRPRRASSRRRASRPLW